LWEATVSESEKNRDEGQQEKSPANFFHRIGILAPVLAALFTLLGAVIATFITSYYGSLSKDRELNIRLVEIGISILRADPKKEDISPARQWAIEVIQRNSGVAFSSDDRAALLHKPIITGYDATFSGGYDSTFSGELDYSQPICKLIRGPRGPYFECSGVRIAPPETPKKE
jgi:hypothetical protein